MKKITIEIADDEVLVALKRHEGYEDVHPELVAEDAIKETWPGYRTLELEGGVEIEALQADAAQYRWLRSQNWNDGTLAVLRSADLPLGVQTFSGQLLDDAITVRRMAVPVPEAGG